MTVKQPMPRALFIGSAGGSFSDGTRVSSEDCRDEGNIGGNRWRITRETESSDRIGRRSPSAASSAD
jgi:hypothetical protein